MSAVILRHGGLHLVVESSLCSILLNVCPLSRRTGDCGMIVPVASNAARCFLLNFPRQKYKHTSESWGRRGGGQGVGGGGGRQTEGSMD